MINERIAKGYRFTFEQNDHTISGKDAEAQLIANQLEPIKGLIADAPSDSVIVVEFHTNFGPCDACKNRIERATRIWRRSLKSGQTLKVGCFYRRKPTTKVRGRDDVETTYGLAGTEPSFTYGADERDEYGLYLIHFGRHTRK